MKKLYQKSEIWFAVGTIIVYVMVAGNLRGNFGDDSIWMMLGMIAMTAVLAVFLVQNGLCSKYGLDFLPKGKPYLYFIPFVLLSLANLYLGVQLHFSPLNQIFAIISMALVGFLEEIIFRGLLFRAIEKESHTRALVISAVTFGAGHIINLLTGQATGETFIQIAYAIAIGFAFVLCFDRCGSLWPCIITHSLIDITSTLSASLNPLAEPSEKYQILTIMVISVGYAVYLARKPAVRK